MKVLIVDDSGTMRTIQRRCLSKLNICDVFEAENGEQALELASAHAFDVVLSDWNMPVMDGLTLLKALRASGSAVPVLMVTTEAERARVVLAIHAGVSDYLVKPFTPEALREKLARWVPVSM